MYKVDLKPHNEQTMEKIIEFFKTSNKCCAIQATGTGKTFLILRLLEMFQNEDKNAVIFAPNREIIKQTKNKMKKYGINNAVFYTYQKLSRMSDNEIVNINVDLIVCDELHRTGAKTWGIKFESLVDSHQNAKVFGVTATPLRCADGRDMAEEYFDNNKACDISLAEALVRKIIPVMPVYVSALYTFEEEYDNMVDKIEKGRNSDEDKSDLMKELKVAKQQLEKSNGIPEIIKKYITDYNGKYIVFCQDKKHLYDMKHIVIQWFRDAGYNGKIFEYVYYSGSKKDFMIFKENNDNGLKLLFVINCLNEGVHLEDINGCILLRPTISNIIYYQQIGRAIDAGCNQKRVILDLVSNFNSLKSFNLKNKLNEKIIDRQNGKFSECSDEFDIEEFYVEDYVQKCVDVFNKVDQKIRSYYYNWTDDEIQILYDKFEQIGATKIYNQGLITNHMIQSIKMKAAELGLVYQNTQRYVPNAKDDKIIKEKYHKLGRKGIMKFLPHMTEGQIKHRASQLGETYDGSLWTKKEDEIIGNNNLSLDDMVKMLDGRSKSAICSRRSKLGVSNNIINELNDEDLKLFIKLYPQMGCKCFELFPYKTSEQLYHLAKKYNLTSSAIHGTSKYKHVMKKANGKYVVYFQMNGKEKIFGTYDSEDEAGKVAMEKAKEYGKI